MCSRKHKRPRYAQGTLLIGCLLSAAAGCSRSRTIATAGGKVSYNEGKMPGDYPKDVPVYTPAKVMVSQTVSEKNARNLMLESPDTVAKIVDFYRKSLDSNGWKNASTFTTAQTTMLIATKEQKQVVLQITDSGDKRSVMQVVSDKQ